MRLIATIILAQSGMTYEMPKPRRGFHPRRGFVSVYLKRWGSVCFRGEGARALLPERRTLAPLELNPPYDPPHVTPRPDMAGLFKLVRQGCTRAFLTSH